MPRLKCVLAYDGTRYAGWQIQELAKAPLTIQGEMERALKEVTGKLVRVHSAGRTDSGVHAEGQVVHFDIPEEKAHLPWAHIFHALLPPDIRVREISEVSPHFHSRFDAVSKTYTYTLWTERHTLPPRLFPYVWDCGPVNRQGMEEAIPYLLGKHDFCSFQNVGTPIADTERTILGMTLEPSSPWIPKEFHEKVLTLHVHADGFLKQMVRNICGLLVSVGQGRTQVEQIPAIFAARSRPVAPPTAPAKGLCLLHVTY